MEKVQVATYLEPALYEQLVSAADGNDRSLAAELRRAVRFYLKSRLPDEVAA